MIRSSKHSLRFSNTGKLLLLQQFLATYRAAVQQSIDFIWSNRLVYNNKVFNVATDELLLPKFLDYKLVEYAGQLSARAFCSAFEQAVDMVRAATQKRKQTLYIRSKLIAEGSKYSHLDKVLQTKYKLVKPNAQFIKAELSSKCIDFSTGAKGFDIFVRLKTGFDHIKLPIKLTKPFNRRKHWKLLTGISISETEVCLRQETETPPIRTDGEIVGADKGMTTVLSLSDGQQTQPDIHGHTFSSIAKKLARKKKGSKSFRRAQQHRLNYINWSIGQLNLDGIKQINMEINSFAGQRLSRFLSHNAFSITDRKTEYLSEELGVQVKPKTCVYKSQRCSSCNLVHKKNRKGKQFQCVGCGFTADADVNSAINNSLDSLPDVPKWAVSNKLNRQGFFWKEEGLFDLLGQECRVPDPEKG